jgi:hypothetical protein
VMNSRRLMELPILPRLPGELKAITFGDDASQQN